MIATALYIDIKLLIPLDVCIFHIIIPLFHFIPLCFQEVPLTPSLSPCSPFSSFFFFHFGTQVMDSSSDGGSIQILYFSLKVKKTVG